MNRLHWISLCLALFYWSSANGATYALPVAGDTIVGELKTVYLEPNQSLNKIARRYDVGYDELIRANPHINPSKPKAWSEITIPSAFILPDAPKEGVIINLPEMRLYYYLTDKRAVMTFPIGVGRFGYSTPVITTKVSQKRQHPIWFVPNSVRRYMANQGVELPEFVEPGPNNPLGDYALNLAARGYLIHGTNRPYSIGKRSSSGCIRLYPEDIKQLFTVVPLGTPVRVINQPYKAGWLNRRFYIEVHRPFGDHPLKINGALSPLRQAVMKASGQRAVVLNWKDIYALTKGYKGYPIYIDKEL